MKLSKVLVDSKPERIVKKLIFEDEKRISETVAYKYSDRTVVCFSCQSGCPVGCVFCGTGKKFVGNLTSTEMSKQIEESLDSVNKERFGKIQIMGMSMGEPMLNFYEFKEVSLLYLGKGYDFFMSTVGVDNHCKYDLVDLFSYSNFGLQISLHSPYEISRKSILGNYENLMSFKEIRNISNFFNMKTGKPVYFNLVVDNGHYDDNYYSELSRVVGNHNHLTVSVLCDKNTASKTSPENAINFARKLSFFGIYNYSIFDPVGQDTIGGGCGQLLYVQDKLKNL